MATASSLAELPRPPLDRAPTPDSAYPLSTALHGTPAGGGGRWGGERSGELTTSSWTRRLDLYLAQYDHEGDARGGARGRGVDAITSGGRTPLGNIDDNRMRYDNYPTLFLFPPRHPLFYFYYLPALSFISPHHRPLPPFHSHTGRAGACHRHQETRRRLRRSPGVQTREWRSRHLPTATSRTRRPCPRTTSCAA